MPCLTIPNICSRYDSSSIFVFAFVLPIFDDLEEEDDDDNNDNNDNNEDDDDDTETPDLVQTQIPSHPGIKDPVRGIPPSDVALSSSFHLPEFTLRICPHRCVSEG